MYLYPHCGADYGCEYMIELQHLAVRHDLGSHDREEREYKREEKWRRKLQRVVQEEEMKFSHSIQFNAVPDWSSHYIGYSNLKKL